MNKNLATHGADNEEEEMSDLKIDVQDLKRDVNGLRGDMARILSLLERRDRGHESGQKLTSEIDHDPWSITI